MKAHTRRDPPSGYRSSPTVTGSDTTMGGRSVHTRINVGGTYPLEDEPRAMSLNAQNNGGAHTHRCEPRRRTQ